MTLKKANRFYLEACEWTKHRALEDVSADVLVDFGRLYGIELKTAPAPTGREARAAAATLLSCVYGWCLEWGSMQEAESWLAIACDVGCVAVGIEIPCLEFLASCQPLAAQHRGLLVRLLQKHPQRHDLVDIARANAKGLLECGVDSPADDARAAARWALLMLDVPSLWTRAAQQAAVALCASNQASAAAPFIQRALARGGWPDAFAPLLAYPRFAASDDTGCVGLIPSWPEDAASLGVAEPGARLRCAIALLRTGDVQTGLEFLQPTRPAYPHLEGSLRALVWATGSAPYGTSPLKFEPGLPDTWLGSYWVAVQQAGQGSWPEFLKALACLVAEEDARCGRWSRDLARWSLRRMLDGSEWQPAMSLLGACRDRGWKFLDDRQCWLVAILAESETIPTAAAQSWFQQVLSDPASKDTVHAALLAAVCRDEAACPLARAAAETADDPASQDAACALCEFLVSQIPPATLAAEIGAGQEGNRWQAMVMAAARKRLEYALAHTPARELAARLANEPTCLVPAIDLLAKAIRGDYAAVEAVLSTDAPGMDSRAIVVIRLCECLLQAHRQDGARENPGIVDILATAVTRWLIGQPSVDADGPPLARLEKAAQAGLPEFLDEWDRAAHTSRSDDSVLFLFPAAREPAPSVGNLVARVLEVAPVEWRVDAPRLPISFDSADLRACGA